MMNMLTLEIVIIHVNIVERYSGNMNKLKTQIHQKKFLCCQNGKVNIPLNKKTPPILDHLLNYYGGSLSANFRKKKLLELIILCLFLLHLEQIFNQILIIHQHHIFSKLVIKYII